MPKAARILCMTGNRDIYRKGLLDPSQISGMGEARKGGEVRNRRCMNEPGRIEIHGSGIGEISKADLERRAREIAQMDGRTEAGEQDRFRAREELLRAGTPPPPEADETTRPVQSWSKGPASQAHRGVRTDLEDEVSPAEQLINEGLEEADHDQRLSASNDQLRRSE